MEAGRGGREGRRDRRGSPRPPGGPPCPTGVGGAGPRAGSPPPWGPGPRQSGGVADILPPVAPKEGETVLTGTVANKFIRTDLQKILKDKGITTVIDVGVAAQGAVITTSSEAAQLGFKVIVPVDAISANFAYPEQYTVWHLANAPVIAAIGTNHSPRMKCSGVTPLETSMNQRPAVGPTTASPSS